MYNNLTYYCTKTEEAISRILERTRGDVAAAQSNLAIATAIHEFSEVKRLELILKYGRDAVEKAEKR